MINGVWQNAAMTRLFDFKSLFDGEFKQYFIRIGVSGLFGGTAGGLSSWINHPFFSNGMVLGVIVGSAFGTVSLASTGDWARFGKNFGLSVASGVAAFGGGTIDGMLGSIGGPIGTAIGTAAGSIISSYVGRKVARNIPWLGDRTEYELQMIYEKIKEGLAEAGLEPDPSLSPRELVTAWLQKNSNQEKDPFGVRITNSLASGTSSLREPFDKMQKALPEKFVEFLNVLRTANKRRMFASIAKSSQYIQQILRLRL